MKILGKLTKITGVAKQLEFEKNRNKAVLGMLVLGIPGAAPQIILLAETSRPHLSAQLSGSGRENLIFLA